MMSLACPRPRPDACVLVGGLGMGYTLAATLALLPPEGSVVVSELIPEVVDWNRGPLGPLAGYPLDDPRTELVVGDVVDVIRERIRGSTPSCSTWTTGSIHLPWRATQDCIRRKGSPLHADPCALAAHSRFGPLASRGPLSAHSTRPVLRPPHIVSEGAASAMDTTPFSWAARAKGNRIHWGQNAALCGGKTPR